MPRNLAASAELLLILYDAAAEALRARGRRRAPDRRERPVAATLRPGSGTPLWNELARQAVPYLRRRGEKAKLGRLLGLPRQRVHEFIRARTACPDAERTLLLLCWVARRRQGRELTS